MSQLDLGTVAFGVLAALTLGSAGVVAFSRNIVHSAIALLGTFSGIAGFYVMLSADFLAATQVLVYVGGTLTLILFAVMLTARIDQTETSNLPTSRTLAGLVIVVLLFVLGKIASDTAWPQTAIVTQSPSTARLGHAFLGDFALPFEIVSLLLLAALIGAVVLARRAVRRPDDDHLEAQ
jgi:NADH:ubiquinone oxidoreductase subunit 6 (subunit J)